MSKANLVNVVVVAAILLVGLVANAQAELLFSDNFNGANNSVDYGLNDNLSSRLDGTLKSGMVTSGTAWARSTSSVTDRVQVNDTTYGPDMLFLGANNGTTNQGVVLQENFVSGTAGTTITAAGGFVCRFDFEPLAAGSVGDRHIDGCGIFLGGEDATVSSANRPGNYDPKADLSLMFYDDGRLIGKDNGTWFPGDYITYDSTPPADYDEWYTAELRVATTDFTPGTGTATVELFVGPKGGPLTQVDLLPLDAGSMSYTLTWDSDAANYLGFFTYAAIQDPIPKNVSQFDNVSLSSIPEPSTLALLVTGLLGLLAYAWRKRK